MNHKKVPLWYFLHEVWIEKSSHFCIIIIKENIAHIRNRKKEPAATGKKDSAGGVHMQGYRDRHAHREKALEACLIQTQKMTT